MSPFLGSLQDRTGQPGHLTSADQVQGRDTGLPRPARLDSSPFTQGILEAGALPADKQPQNNNPPAARSSTPGLQADLASRGERCHSIAIPGRPSSSWMAQADSAFRPASAGDASHSSARLSRRSSSGLMQGSPDVRPVSAQERPVSSSTSPAGAGSKGVLRASTDFRPASAGDRLYSSGSPARLAGTGLLQASLHCFPASFEDRSYAISINGSPQSDADREARALHMVSAGQDRHGRSKHPMHSSSSLPEACEADDRQELLTSLKSHRVASFRHREAASGLSRRLQRALQTCERARRHALRPACNWRMELCLLSTCNLWSLTGSQNQTMCNIWGAQYQSCMLVLQLWYR